MIPTDTDRAIEAFIPADPQPFAGIKRWWRAVWTGAECCPPIIPFTGGMTSQERAEIFEEMVARGRNNFPTVNPRRRMSPLALRLMAASNAFCGMVRRK